MAPLSRFFSALGVAFRNGTISFLDYYRTELDPLTRDALTMAWNRPHFERRRKQIGAYTLLLFDIDNFKQINDSYGHSVGDVVLKAVASVLRTASGDRVFRIGGEEFAVLLANCTTKDAAKVAERLCAKVRSLEVLDGAPVTVSVGVATVVHLPPGKASDEAHDSVYKQADQALYYAKWTGKNRVAVFDGIPLESHELHTRRVKRPAA